MHSENALDTVLVTYGKKTREYEIPEMPELLKEQVEDGNFLVAEQSAAMFSEPGTGKTLTALVGMLAAWDAHYSSEADNGRPPPSLIVVPNIAVRNWAKWSAAILCKEYGVMGREIEGVIQIVKSGSDQIGDKTDILIVTYGMLSRRKSKIRFQILDWEPKIVILDESDNLNGWESVRTKVIYGEASFGDGLTSRADYVWPLTGTPVRRYADDLWPVLKALRPKLMKAQGWIKRSKFVEKFCHEKLMKFPGARFPKKVVVGNKNLEELHAFIYDNNIARRRTLAELVEHLPSVREREIDIEIKVDDELADLTEKAMQVFMEADEYGEMVDVRSPAMAKVQRLLGVAKVKPACDYLESIIAEYEDDQAPGVLALAWHTDVLDALVAEMTARGFDCAKIDGSTSELERYRAEDHFNKRAITFLFGQIAAMGVSLNLQAGGYRAVFAERSWSAAGNEQGWKRLFRMGQESDVLVDYLISQSPLEDPRTRVLGRKQSGMDKIVDGKF